MVWYKWKWWRFSLECGEGVKSSTLRIDDGYGVWKPILNTRLLFLIERKK